MTTRQRSKLQHTAQAWKTKALRRGQQLKQANKRIRELTQSRDQWKRKAQARHATLSALHVEVKRLRQRLDGSEKNRRPPLSICPQSSDHPDVSRPQTPDIGQFSSRCQKQ